MLHRRLEERTTDALAAAPGADRELFEVGIERARIERGRKRSSANPSGPSPPNRTTTSPLSIRGAARSAITSASGVDSPNSALNACRSLRKTRASAALARRIGVLVRGKG
jgi:hypothetical protein